MHPLVVAVPYRRPDVGTGGTVREADAQVAAGIAERRVRALARAEALARDLADIVERSAEASRDDEHDPEGATIGFERAQVTALLDAAHAEVAALEAAAVRLDAGTHGICANCGVAIPDERRIARPTSRICVTCAVRT